jgi:hypothetical protein
MGGALIVTAIGYRSSSAAARFRGPVQPADRAQPRCPPDRRLGVFGIGWGIAGFCPGGALPALGTGMPEVFIFTAAMIAGIFGAKYLQSLSRPAPTATS